MRLTEILLKKFLSGSTNSRKSAEIFCDLAAKNPWRRREFVAFALPSTGRLVV
jgi:hypothetical protein